MPTPAGDDELLVDVIAAGLHPRVRSQAAGSHDTMGSMAEQTVIDARPRCHGQRRAHRD